MYRAVKSFYKTNISCCANQYSKTCYKGHLYIKDSCLLRTDLSTLFGAIYYLINLYKRHLSKKDNVAVSLVCLYRQVRLYFISSLDLVQIFTDCTSQLGVRVRVVYCCLFLTCRIFIICCRIYLYVQLAIIGWCNVGVILKCCVAAMYILQIIYWFQLVCSYKGPARAV